MLSFTRIFQTRQQALDVYKTQLSSQFIYVESFEAYSAGTAVLVELQNRENGQNITLNATVERAIGKTEVVEKRFGMRSGLILHVDITPELVSPLRSFFLAGSDAPVIAKTVTEASAPVQVVRPAAVSHDTQPVRHEAVQPVQPVRPAAVHPVRPKFASAASPASDGAQVRLPLENLPDLPAATAIRDVGRFCSLAASGSLYRFFNATCQTDRKSLRNAYNKLVRILHPDRHQSGYTEELTEKLIEAYQLLNDAYEILQNPVKNDIYLEVSRLNRAPEGMSLNDYKKFMEDYSTKNAANIRLADDLAVKAEQAMMAGNREVAAKNVNLALQYDPYHEVARAIKLG